MYSVEYILTCESFMLWQALLRSDLPFYMVPFATGDLAFKKPEVCAVTIRLIFLYSRLLFPEYLSLFFFLLLKSKFWPRGESPLPPSLGPKLTGKKKSLSFKSNY